MENKTKSILKKIFVIAFWLAVWQVLYLLIGQNILFSSPIDVGKRLFILGQESFFWKSIGISMLRILLGYVLGLFFGFLLAICTAFSPTMRSFLHPLLSVIRATPVNSFILLMLFWFTTGMIPVYMTFLMVLGLVWANVEEGFAAADPDLLEMTQVFGFGKIQTFKHLYLPAVKPFFSAASITALGFAWKSGIAAEVICHPSFAIGSQLYNAKVYLETVDMLAWTFVVILISMVLEKLVTRLLRTETRSIKKGGALL